MSYRERTAWLSLIAMVITFGPYFAIVAAGLLPSAGIPNLRMLGWYAAVAMTQLLILGVGRLYLRHAFPDDARMPPDERDREITGRAVTSAYYVLIFGMILVGCIMPFGSNGWAIVNAAIFMIAGAEVVRYGTAVVSYRRQSS